MLLLLHYPPSPTTLLQVLLRLTSFYSIFLMKNTIQTRDLLVFIKLVISLSLSLLFFALSSLLGLFGAFRFLGLCFLFASLLPLLLPLLPLLLCPFLSYLSCVSLLNNHFYAFDCIDSYSPKMVDYFF